MRLHVVRHGRTATNAEGRLLGRADPPLDELGREQAAAAAALLGPACPSARIVSSPLLRARETAAVIAGAVGSDVVVDERWIELDYGELEGVPLAEVDPDFWSRWRADPGLAPPGGESLADVFARVAVACDEIAHDAGAAASAAEVVGAGGSPDVIVVTHVSPVKAALGWAIGGDATLSWRTFVGPGSITSIDLRPAGPVLLSFDVTPGTLPG